MIPSNLESDWIFRSVGSDSKANDYRLIARVQYSAGVLMIRFFGSHEEYHQVDATV